MNALSLDLRKRVLAVYDETGHKTNTCKQFNIGRPTLNYWIRLRDETGSLEQPSWESGPKHMIKDWAAFEAFVKASQFDTVVQLAVLYEAHFGEPISLGRLYRALKKIGWTPKKRVSATVRPIAAGRRSSTG